MTMCLRLVSMSFISLVSVSAAAEERPYSAAFAQAYRACAEQFPQDIVSATTNYSTARENCYVDSVAKSFAMLPPDSPARFVNALQAAPDYASAIFELALAAGMDPYYAVMVATRSLPQYERTFASTAIARGADPSQVTEATAAGKR